VLDELHFLRGRRTSAIEVSNQFKTIANDFPVTVLMIGIDLASLGLLGEGTGRASALDQTARRTTRLSIAPFEVESDQGRQEWRNLLLALEQRVVLAEKFPGMIADELADYLFARSTGHISSLITLINRGCQRAIRTGVERLDRGVMDMVKNDVDAERARKELEAALAAGRITTRIASGGTRS
jgi:hypothetical protein